MKDAPPNDNFPGSPGPLEDCGFEGEPSPRWDADDPRRQRDCFAPPSEACECYCLHCGRVFMSDRIWLQRVVGGRDGFDGFWMCPTPNCDGAGFTFDIFPTDPVHPANEGWHTFDDGEEYDEDCFDEEGNYIEPEDRVYNPQEPKYLDLDAELEAASADDIEGEQWKYGLQPGEKLPEPEWAADAREQWEEEQKRYEEPDLRPRVIDWSDREAGPNGSAGLTSLAGSGGSDFCGEDIPF
jgi:hypothetical protein